LRRGDPGPCLDGKFFLLSFFFSFCFLGTYSRAKRFRDFRVLWPARFFFIFLWQARFPARHQQFAGIGAQGRSGRRGGKCGDAEQQVMSACRGFLERREPWHVSGPSEGGAKSGSATPGPEHGRDKTRTRTASRRLIAVTTTAHTFRRLVFANTPDV